MKKTLHLLVGLIMVISSISCKKDKSSSSGSKMELLTEKSWKMTSVEIWNPISSKWQQESIGVVYEHWYFYADGKYQVKDSRGGGSPNAYPIISNGTWSFSGNETVVTTSGRMYDFKTLNITELSNANFKFEGTGMGGEKYKIIMVHP